MWNLLEKGKALAANIDKQLNESVGVDGGGAPPSSHPTTTTTNDDDDDLNDAWNDDFDIDISAKPPAVEEPPTVEPIRESINETKQDAGDNGADDDGWDDDENIEFDAVDMHNKEEAVIAPPAPIETARSALTALEEPPIMPTENMVSPVVKAEPEPEPEVPKEKLIATKPEDTPVATEEKPAQPAQQEGGWEEEMYDDVEDEGDDDDDDDNSNNDGDGEEEEEDNGDNGHEDAEGKDEPREEQNEVSDEQPPMREIVVTPGQQNGDPPQEAPPATIYESLINEEVMQQQNEQYKQAIATMQKQMEQLKLQVRQREDQLAKKSEQLATMQALHESETNDLKIKIRDTKEEAKRRIQKAKEKLDAMESSLQSAGRATEAVMEKEEIISALRNEGEALARKQSEMEKAVRAAKGDARELQHSLEEERAAKEKALAKITSLEADLKSTKEDLASARKGESQAGKLETELNAAKEECEKKAATNLALEQNVKELKAELKEIRKDMEAARKGAALENKRESNKLRKEHDDMLTEMEAKLRNSEREAGVREDALRQEVADLRKRWQDSVRRADSLSMDVQSSTAPLLRQLESMERQNRARSTAWAELETSLRTELEDTVIENEKLTKERNDLKTSSNRLKRIAKEREDDLVKCKATIEDQTIKIDKLEAQVRDLESEAKRRKEDYDNVEKLANEGVARVRSEMTRTVVESEERYRAQIKSIENELSDEKSKRTQLERQVEELLENAGMAVVPVATNAPTMKREKPKKLKSAEGQADILAKSISGLGEEAEDDEDDFNSDEDDFDVVEEEKNDGLSSFAAMEQLNQRLKAAKVELEALRKSLRASERTRESLVEELSETRQAKEKLPLFEQKVQELSVDNQQKAIEIMTLTEDIAEIRQLYRSQLNALLEEKAASLTAGKGEPGTAPPSEPIAQQPPPEPEVNGNASFTAPVVKPKSLVD